MSPKAKAVELYSKHEDSIKGLEGSEWWESAKKCALVTVDQILKMPNIGFSNKNDESQYDYWQEVKQEIEKL